MEKLKSSSPYEIRNRWILIHFRVSLNKFFGNQTRGISVLEFSSTTFFVGQNLTQTVHIIMAENISQDRSFFFLLLNYQLFSFFTITGRFRRCVLDFFTPHGEKKISIASKFEHPAEFSIYEFGNTTSFFVFPHNDCTKFFRKTIFPYRFHANEISSQNVNKFAFID